VIEEQTKHEVFSCATIRSLVWTFSHAMVTIQSTNQFLEVGKRKDDKRTLIQSRTIRLCVMLMPMVGSSTIHASLPQINVPFTFHHNTNNQNWKSCRQKEKESISKSIDPSTL